jgi:threonine synthase
MDPHTAVAYGVYQKLNDDTKTLVVSTASPYKFTDTIKEALSIECDDDLLFEEISKRTNTIIPKVISTYKMNKKNVWLKEDVYENFEKLIKELGYDKD